MAETEFKYRLSPEALARWRGLLQEQNARTLALEALYFDSADGDLGRAHVSLRLRREDRRWVQTLKTAGDSPIRRQEHEVPVPWSGSRSPPVLDLRRHDGTEAGALLHDVLGRAERPQLLPRHRVAVTRLVRTVRTRDGSVLELALDEGHVRAGAKAEPIAELEIEHVDGPVEGLFDVARDVVSAGGAWLSTISKSARGSRLGGTEDLRAVKAGAFMVARDADARTWLNAALRNTLGQILPNASAIADDAYGADHVHQLRVGLRRLRTLWRELPDLAPALSECEPVLRAAFAALGLRRDDDAVADAVGPLLAAVGAPKVDWSREATPEPASVVRGPAFQQALVQLLAQLHGVPPDGPSMPHDRLMELLTERLDRLHRQVLRGGRHFERLPVDAQHRVRKRLKRLRYLSELVAGLWPRRRVQRYADALKPAQQALGDHNDTWVAAERFAQDAASDPRALFAAGFMQARLAQTSRRARKSLERIAEVKRFWRR